MPSTVATSPVRVLHALLNATLHYSCFDGCCQCAAASFRGHTNHIGCYEVTLQFTKGVRRAHGSAASSYLISIRHPLRHGLEAMQLDYLSRNSNDPKVFRFRTGGGKHYRISIQIVMLLPTAGGGGGIHVQNRIHRRQAFLKDATQSETIDFELHFCDMRRQRTYLN